jgi:hypothetical protein
MGDNSKGSRPCAVPPGSPFPCGRTGDRPAPSRAGRRQAQRSLGAPADERVRAEADLIISSLETMGGLLAQDAPVSA